MTLIASQFALNTVETNNAKTQFSQFAMISVGDDAPPNSKPQLSQFVLIAVIEAGQIRLALSNPIKLNCWQPCASYGTRAIVVRLGR